MCMSKMWKYTRKCSNGCSRAIEVAVMEVAPVAEKSGSTKRRKVGSGELRLSSSKSERITSRNSDDVIATLKNFSDSVDEEDFSDQSADVTSFISGEVQASCCLSNGSVTDKLECADLEKPKFETTARHNLDRRESTPASKFTEEKGEVQSSPTGKRPVLNDHRRTIPAEKMPPAAELEEFFAAAEKDLHKRFKDKYNFDIVKDSPLEGRFEWVELKP